MKKEDFLKPIEQNCSHILYISVKHILDKLYNDDELLDENKLKEFFSDYNNFHLYLNDYAGVIYNRNNSSIDNLYMEMCDYLNINIDNQYTVEHTINKLEKQTPQLLLSLTDQEIQEQTINHFIDKLELIENSSYYKQNNQKFIHRIEKLHSNINLVKNALQMS